MRQCRICYAPIKSARDFETACAKHVNPMLLPSCGFDRHTRERHPAAFLFAVQFYISQGGWDESREEAYWLVNDLRTALEWTR